MIATLSPFATPSERKPQATSSTISPASPKETARQPASSLTRNAGYGRESATAACHIAATVRMAAGYAVGPGREELSYTECKAARYPDSAHAHHLERLPQLRPRDHPGRPRRRAAAPRRVLPDAAPRVRQPDQAEALVPVPRAGCGGRGARQRLGVREGPVRDDRGQRPRVGRAPALALD